ncbi:hypothetical protein GCM10009765_59970 [Fodinicola feengrottensis]|uniref:Uncharacterized protein n=1 Tax=Fodinicola feengrottensis TaxID=435914 RepID=A0ABP4UBS4_9ACTN
MVEMADKPFPLIRANRWHRVNPADESYKWIEVRKYKIFGLRKAMEDP